MSNQKRCREHSARRSVPSNGFAPTATELPRTRGGNKLPKLISQSAATDLAKARALARARAEADFKWITVSSDPALRRSISANPPDRSRIQAGGEMAANDQDRSKSTAVSSHGPRANPNVKPPASTSPLAHREPTLGFGALAYTRADASFGVSAGSAGTRASSAGTWRQAVRTPHHITVGVALIPQPPLELLHSASVGAPSILRAAPAPSLGLDMLACWKEVQPAAGSGTSTVMTGPFSPLGHLLHGKQQGAESSFWNKPAYPQFGKESETMAPSPVSRLLGRVTARGVSPRFRSSAVSHHLPGHIATSAPKSTAGLALSCAPVLTPLADVTPYLGKPRRASESRSFLT